MFAIVESMDEDIRHVTIRNSREEAVRVALDMADTDGVDRDDALDGLDNAGYYEDGQFRVTVIEVSA